MIRKAIFLLICAWHSVAFAQRAAKPALDTGVFHHWEELRDPAYLSPDGKLVICRIHWNSILEKEEKDEVVLRSLEKNWELRLPIHGGAPDFGKGHRWVVLQTSADSLAIVKTESAQITYLAHTAQHWMIGNVLVYQLQGAPSDLYLRNLDDLRETVINGITKTIFGPRDNTLMLVQANGTGQRLSGLRSPDLVPTLIWDGGKVENLFSDWESGQWAFLSASKLYTWSAAKGLRNFVLSTDQPPAELRFINSGQWLTYQVAQPEKTQPKKAGVIIWNYLDPAAGVTANQDEGSTGYALNLETGRSLQLSTGNESLLQLDGNYALISRPNGNGPENESSWNRFSGSHIDLVNLTDHSRQTVPSNDLALFGDGKYFWYANRDKHQVMIAETSTKRVLFQIPLRSRYFPGTWRWLPERQALLIQDGYDFWEFDTRTLRPPVCITGHYGQQKHIVFTFLYPQTSVPGPHDDLVLAAHDEQSNASGFFSVRLGLEKEPVQLHWAECKDSEATSVAGNWLFRRTWVDRPPEYVLTKDFKHFRALPAPKPELAFNWFTCETLHYDLPDGNKTIGFLYKPENFDPTKKYPLILTYYQRIDGWRGEYPDASQTLGRLNIPWMVSRGYLVFIPDIVNEPDHAGESALRCILAASDYLKRFSFVDPAKIGITGHSFGGFETAYAATHSHCFAAAFAASPATDMFLMHAVCQSTFWQTGIQPAPWENLQPYVESSSMLAPQHLTTPLLIMGNQGDFLWPQPKELFDGLRRLGKPAWMLQYPGQGHILSGEAEVDLTLRVQEFFDHYLKGAPMPQWMQSEHNSILTPEAQLKADSLSNTKN